MTTATDESPQKVDWGMIARLLITAMLLLLCGWWLWVVAQKLSIEPVLSSDGKVVFDQFQRAKDVLLAVLPLLTLALGYWFGTQGTAKAEQKADEAKKDAKTAQEQVVAIVGASTDVDLLAKAQSVNPRAFGLEARP